jgi:hypothetical protein
MTILFNNDIILTPILLIFKTPRDKRNIITYFKPKLWYLLKNTVNLLYQLLIKQRLALRYMYSLFQIGNIIT